LLVAVALAVSMVSGALAQADDDTPLAEDVPPVDTSLAAPSGAPTLFLSLADPFEQDVEVPLDTAQLMIQGTTLPGAVVSIDGNLADMDDQGNVGGVVVLDQGANEIDVVASDDQGNQINTSVFITRGE